MPLSRDLRAQNRLHEIRHKEFMMTKKEFADYLKVEYSSYLRWESGEVDPEIPMALYISEKLGRTVNDIWYRV